MLTCTNCGAENAQGSKFCSSCGTKLEVLPVPSQFNDNVIAGDVDFSTTNNITNNYNTTVYQNTEKRYFKCKMCGEKIEVEANKSVVTCEFCNTPQSVPKIDDEHREKLYDRAEHFRRNKDFDKAIKIYDQLLNIDNTDAEAYWSIVLCKYGIEYVDDPATMRKIPTCHRASYDSIIADDDYKMAIKYADRQQKDIYEAAAREIDNVQKEILALAEKEEKYDIFICYKETDANGNRTIDSVRANEIYYSLTEAGFKVFYAAITLEGKLGSEYEPIIFAALNSAKVMLVVGTKPEYFNAVWVKNEWSRYIRIMKKDRSRALIPCYADMDAYDLPEEFSHFQAQDMGKIGFINDVVRGIKKVLNVDAAKKSTTSSSAANSDIAPLLKRAFMFLEEAKWAEATEYCERVLDKDPECADAYLGKLMVELRAKVPDDLKKAPDVFDNSENYKKAMRFGNDEMKSNLRAYIAYINTKKETERLDAIYHTASIIMDSGNYGCYKEAAQMFNSISHHKDAAEMAKKCIERENERLYLIAKKEFDNAKTSIEFRKVYLKFKALENYKDSANLESLSLEKMKECPYNQAKDILKNARNVYDCVVAQQAFEALYNMYDYKDSKEMMDTCLATAKEILYKQASAKMQNPGNNKDLQLASRYFDILAKASYKDSAEKSKKCFEIILEKRYKVAMEAYNEASSVQEYMEAKVIFETLDQKYSYKDSKQMVEQCAEKCKEVLYQQAYAEMEKANTESAYLLAANHFQKIKKELANYKDSAELEEYCRQKANEIREANQIKENEATLKKGIASMQGGTVTAYKAAIATLERIKGYKNADELIAQCKQELERIRIEDERYAQSEAERRRKQEKRYKLRKEVFGWAVCLSIIAYIVAFFVVWKKVDLGTAFLIGGIASFITGFSMAMWAPDKGEKFTVGNFIFSIIIVAIIFELVGWGVWAIVHRKDNLATINGETVNKNCLSAITLNIDKTDITIGETIAISFTTNPKNPKTMLFDKGQEKAYEASCIEFYVRINGEDKRINNGRETTLEYTPDTMGELVFWAKFCCHTSPCSSPYDIYSEEIVVKVSGQPISSASDLSKLNNSSGNFELVNDIDLSGVKFTPIENFTGNFNGNGHTIKNLKIKASSSTVGLFSVLSGNVSNLKLENVDITVTGEYADVGAICGKLYGSVKDCYASGNITAEECQSVGGIIGAIETNSNISLSGLESAVNVKGKKFVGGVLGYLFAGDTVFSDFKNSGNVTANGDYAGGLIGITNIPYSNGAYHIFKMSNSSSTGDVVGKQYVGGLFGELSSVNQDSYVSSSSCSANIEGETYVGGIAGRISCVVVDNCTNTGSTINATGYFIKDSANYAYVGGFAGYGYIFKNCKNEVEINYTSDGMYVGGIAGYACREGEMIMENLENVANITGASYVGGIFGYQYSGNAQYTNVKNSGDITARGNFVGGLFGYAWAPYFSGAYHTINIGRASNTGDIAGKCYVGGFVGMINVSDSKSYIKNSSNISKIEGEAYVGCIGGKIANVVVNNCTNAGSELVVNKYVLEDSKKRAYIGGFAGYGYQFNNCKNEVEINYTAGGMFVGGIAGYVSREGDMPMENLENVANITGADYVGGLFGYQYSGNAHYQNMKNSGNVTASGDFVGGLFGYAYAPYFSGAYHTINIDNGSNTGDIVGKCYVGGLVGMGNVSDSKSYIKNSENISKVEGEAYVGCIGGKIVNIVIENCSNAGSELIVEKYILEDSNKRAYIGGFAGYGYQFNNCKNEVEINYTAGGSFVGGIAGYASREGDMPMENLENVANITGADYVGGIFGYQYSGNAQYTNLSNSGNITASGSYVGGLFGCVKAPYFSGSNHTFHLLDSENTGNVTGDTYVGGIIGFGTASSNNSAIYDSTSTGTVEGTSDFGEIAGKLENITID